MSEHVSRNQDTILRGSDQQQTTKRTRNLLYEGPQERLLPHRGPGASMSWPTQLDEVAQVQVTQGQTGMRLQAFELHNRSAATIVVGIGFRWANRYWKMGDWDTTATTASVFLNADYQSRTATTFFSGITEADEDGVIIWADAPFNWVSMNVTTASVNAGASDADIDYSGTGGASWITQTALQSFVDTLTIAAGELATGEKLLAWNPPHDWTPVERGTLLHIAGVPEGQYAINYRWSDIPTTDVVVTGVEIGSMKFSGEELADNGLFENEQMSWVDFRADGVAAFFETAAPGNAVDFEVSPAG